MAMPGWFDLSSLDDLTDSKYDDEQGLLKSVDAVDRLVQAEIDAGIPENKIVVGGFSQGGAIAMLYGLTKGRNLAGMVGLSTWVVLNHKIEEVSTLMNSISPELTSQMTKSSAKDVPVFWGHGKADPVVQYECESSVLIWGFRS